LRARVLELCLVVVNVVLFAKLLGFNLTVDDNFDNDKTANQIHNQEEVVKTTTVLGSINGTSRKVAKFQAYDDCCSQHYENEENVAPLLISKFMISLLE